MMTLREEIKKKIANAKHMSKPNAKNAVVMRDTAGRWIFEIYTKEHTLK